MITLTAMLTPQMAWSFFFFAILKTPHAKTPSSSVHISPMWAPVLRRQHIRPAKSRLTQVLKQPNSQRLHPLCVHLDVWISPSSVWNGDSWLGQSRPQPGSWLLVSAGCSVSTFCSRAVCCWQIASWSKEVMKIFPLANVSNLSLTRCEALGESLTHPFLLLYQGKASRTQV